MEQKLPRDFFWVDKNTMGDFLKEPLNRKLYNVYLGIKRKTPSQDYQTLKLFNEVYYQCCKIVYERNVDIELKSIIHEVKVNLGWDFSTSMVLNMIYAILSLRRGNSEEVLSVIKKIEGHYRLEEYKTPFYIMTLDSLKHGDLYDLEPKFTKENNLSATEIPIKIENQNKGVDIHITLNLNNQFTGEIKELNVNSPGNIVGKEIKM